MTNPMIYRQCSAIDPYGIKTQVKVGVEHPEFKDGVWSSKIQLGIILQDERRAYGADEWDAVQNAMCMVYLELRMLKAAGWNFYGLTMKLMI